jgi:1-Cys peroxiredoxin 6
VSGAFPYPIIADPKRELATELGMLDAVDKDAAGIPLAARAVCDSSKIVLWSHLEVFIVGPDKRLKLSLLYPATTGRNFEFVLPTSSFSLIPDSEILRVIDSLQLTMYEKVCHVPLTSGLWSCRTGCHPCQLEARRALHGSALHQA